MSNFRNVIKDGWHPKGKDGSKESWRGDFKGINQVAGWMGKGKQPGSGGGEGSDHLSRPLSALKDPSLFGPPPKNVNYHGGVALPNEITPHTGGIGAPLTQEEIRAAERAVHQKEEPEEEVKPAGPPLPYRADHTGLKTDHLPPPPIHRNLRNPGGESDHASKPPTKPKPGLPPRLPSRQNSSNAPAPVASPPPALPTYDTAVQNPVQIPVQNPVPANNFLNQGAINRLGKAGVSVSGFGIGDSNPWKAERSQTTPTTTSPPQSIAPPPSQLSELQSRFSRMNSGSPKPMPQAQPPSQAQPLSPQPIPNQTPNTPQIPAEGTTLAQKQAAIQTAQNFHRDPSSVTLADAKSAATTANNFRERHQDQISAGAQKANAWNKKFNVTGRLNTFLEKQVSPASEQPPTLTTTANPTAMTSPPPLLSPSPSANAPEVIGASITRKPPPPPKKPAGMHAPPPVPIGTKPSFG